MTTYPSSRYCLAICSSSMFSLGQLDKVRGILASHVQELISLAVAVEQDSRTPANLHRSVTAHLNRLRIANLPVVVVDELVQRVADRLEHIVFIKRGLVPFVKANQREFQVFRLATVHDLRPPGATQRNQATYKTQRPRSILH